MPPLRPHGGTSLRLWLAFKNKCCILKQFITFQTVLLWFALKNEFCIFGQQGHPQQLPGGLSARVEENKDSLAGPALPDGEGGTGALALAASHPARATAPRGIAVSALCRARDCSVTGERGVHQLPTRQALYGPQAPPRNDLDLEPVLHTPRSPDSLVPGPVTAQEPAQIRDRYDPNKKNICRFHGFAVAFVRSVRRRGALNANGSDANANGSDANADARRQHRTE